MPTALQIILFVAICVGAFFWWKIPILQRSALLRKYESAVASGQIKEIELEKLADDYRKTVTQAITAALVLVSATVAFEQMEVGRQQSDRTQQNTQFAKGFDLIASEKMYQRVGGISALREVAELSNDKYPSIVYAMTSFIVQSTGGKHRLTGRCDEYTARNRPNGKESMAASEDIQEALNLLRRRPAGLGLDNDLSGSGLAYADLKGVDLTRAHLAFVDLSGANLEGANFEAADLYCANFYHARLSGANFHQAAAGEASFIGVTLDNADFRGAMLPWAIFSNVSSMNGVNFSGADLSNANFYFSNMTNVTFDASTKLEGACLGDVANLPDSARTAENWNGGSKFYTPRGTKLTVGPCQKP